jgi:hypothetical protein
MNFHNLIYMKYKFIKNPHFVNLSGKPMIPHLLRYQGLAVGDYGFALDALNLQHLRLSLN